LHSAASAVEKKGQATLLGPGPQTSKPRPDNSLPKGHLGQGGTPAISRRAENEIDKTSGELPTAHMNGGNLLRARNRGEGKIVGPAQ